jgi:hypothetical protein
MTCLRSFIRASLLLTSAACAIACSAHDTQHDEPAAALPPVHLEMHLTVPPAAELFRCQFVKLPSVDTDEMFIGGYTHEYTRGSHHYLLYKTSLVDPPPGTVSPFDCGAEGGIMRYATGIVAGGQVPKGGETYPAGVALPLLSGQVLVLQAHYINTTDAPIDATVSVDLALVDPASVKHRAGMAQLYDPFIVVPPRSKAQAQMRCTTRRNVTLVKAIPHMHARGVAHETFIDSSGAPPADAPLVSSTDWQHPTEFTGDLLLSAGSALRIRCDYQSDLDFEILQGQSADKNEMCTLGIVYYPAAPPGEPVCDEDQFGVGDKTCAETSRCIQACPPDASPRNTPGLTGVDVGECWQRCMVDACPNVSRPLQLELGCVSQSCASACSGTSAAECAACVTTKCAAQFQACESLACGQ